MMTRLVCLYSLKEIEELVKDVPNSNLMQGVFLKIINTYMECHNVAWFGCRRMDWKEIALLSVQQTVEIRRVLAAAGKLISQTYFPPVPRRGMAIKVHTTLQDPPLPTPNNVYVYQPGEAYARRGRSEREAPRT